MPCVSGHPELSGLRSQAKGRLFAAGSEEFQRAVVASVLKLFGGPQTRRAQSEAEAPQCAGRGRKPRSSARYGRQKRSRHPRNRAQPFVERGRRTVKKGCEWRIDTTVGQEDRIDEWTVG